jgi:hypothetical protein
LLGAPDEAHLAYAWSQSRVVVLIWELLEPAEMRGHLEYL